MDIRIKRAISVINHIIDDLGFQNPKQFSDSLGFDRPERIYKILRGKTGISKNLAEVIHKKYPQYDYNWLLTGQGEMLKANKVESPVEKSSQEASGLDLMTVRNEIRSDLKIILDGMTTNFEVINEGILQGLKGQQKVLKFIEKMDQAKIYETAGALREYLKQHE